MKVCIACSAGGHLTEIMQLEKCFSRKEHFFLTFKRRDSAEMSKKHKTLFITNPARNPAKLLKNMLQSIGVFIKERPDVILTTGAGVVIPFCFISKIFRKKIIYLESFCRVKEPSLTGRILYPISDLFLVQWPEMVQKYGKKAEYLGGVF